MAIAQEVLEELREEETRIRLLQPKTQKSKLLWDLRGQREAKKLAGPVTCYKLLARKVTD